MTSLTDYKPLPKLTDLDPGIDVFEFNILVLPRELAEKTKGGIIMAEQHREREEEAGIEGLVVRTGEYAFHFEDSDGQVQPWDKRPQVGEVVMFARYAGGRNFIGTDGRRYRIMKDKDVLGVRRHAKAEAV
jgi:co-chaperonin GroES (HSP10)